jgi:uncharacterized repeat protein (TIGR03803 family)
MFLALLPGCASEKNSLPLSQYVQLRRLKAFCVTLFAVLCLLLATTAWGQEKVLYSFTGLADGGKPAAGLVRDAAGNMFGVAPDGGDQEPEQCQTTNYGCGVVFEVTPNANGKWTQTVIHTFTGGSDGLTPQGNLILDSADNLYGTTEYGGTGCDSYYGCGTVYELSPQENGSWTETILYNFKAGTDGYNPSAGLIFDSAGNLYGTTANGDNTACNTLGCGSVFELIPGTDGTWTEKILYVFTGGTDGGESSSPLIFDTAGNLYGTAAIGGDDTSCNAPFGCGTIYKLSPGSGNWEETVLKTFEGNDEGAYPHSGLTLGAHGVLYGDISNSGSNGTGSIFKLTPETGGHFTFSTIYNFDLEFGAAPSASLLLSGDVLYGTLYFGGSDNHICPLGCGGVFHVTTGGTDYTFFAFGAPTNGANPTGTVILDSAGNLYGTTTIGGTDDEGTAFELKQPF